MKYLQATIVFGLFSWLSFAVYTDTLPGSDGGSSKTRTLRNLVSATTEQFGVLQSSVGLLAAGFGLAAYFLFRREEYYHEYED